MLTFVYKLKSFLLYAALFLSCAQPAWAENSHFTSNEFLKMSLVQRALWLHGAVTVMTHFAAVDSKEKGQCVHDWYFKEDLQARKNEIYRRMSDHPITYPTAVLFVMAESACGDFYSNYKIKSLMQEAQ